MASGAACVWVVTAAVDALLPLLLDAVDVPVLVEDVGSAVAVAVAVVVPEVVLDSGRAAPASYHHSAPLVHHPILLRVHSNMPESSSYPQTLSQAAVI